MRQGKGCRTDRGQDERLLESSECIQYSVQLLHLFRCNEIGKGLTDGSREGFFVGRIIRVHTVQCAAVTSA